MSGSGLKAVTPGAVFRKGDEDSVERVPLLNEVSQRITNANDRLTAQVIRIRDINDSILGGAINGEAKSGGNPPSVSRMHELERLTSGTHELLDFLDREIERLGTL